ncbi:MAG: DUF6640 family protein [Hyphomicrobium sp.]
MLGRLLLSFVAVFTAVSPFLADWNETHIFNPAWPPHAKFHNAQTMAMAVLLALAALGFLWLRRRDPVALASAAVLCAVYWGSQSVAFLFPGVAYTDPEFAAAGPQPIAGLAPQQMLEAVAIALVALGYALACRAMQEELP